MLLSKPHKHTFILEICLEDGVWKSIGTTQQTGRRQWRRVPSSPVHAHMLISLCGGLVRRERERGCCPCWLVGWVGLEIKKHFAEKESEEEDLGRQRKGKSIMRRYDMRRQLSGALSSSLLVFDAKILPRRYLPSPSSLA